MSNIANNSIEQISTDKAAMPLGHYSQAIKYNDLLFVSGQLGIDPDNTTSLPKTIAQETTIVLNNLNEILIKSGTSKRNVLKVTIFISDIDYWPAVNEVYAEFFGEHKPARSAVPTKNLPKGFRVEIEAIAAIS
tara:strand:- start:1214 stop:1615 length:402 start_codon:yes stop_codon:yes gene_type:complete